MGIRLKCSKWKPPQKNVGPCILFSVVWEPKKAGFASRNRDGSRTLGSRLQIAAAAFRATLGRVDFCIFLIALALVSSELAHKSTVMD